MWYVVHAVVVLIVCFCSDVFVFISGVISYYFFFMFMYLFRCSLFLLFFIVEFALIVVICWPFFVVFLIAVIVLVIWIMFLPRWEPALYRENHEEFFFFFGECNSKLSKNQVNAENINKEIEETIRWCLLYKNTFITSYHKKYNIYHQQWITNWHHLWLLFKSDINKCPLKVMLRIAKLIEKNLP